MTSKYSNEIYEITKVKNNSVIIKDEKGNLYKIKKDEIKVVPKPINNVVLKAKKSANKEAKIDRILKKENIQHENIIRQPRERKKTIKMDL